jgi:hypothetical protein
VNIRKSAIDIVASNTNANHRIGSVSTQTINFDGPSTGSLKTRRMATN